MTFHHSTHLLQIHSVLVLIVWCNMVILSRGHDAALYFKNSHTGETSFTISFPDDRLKRFFECLCDSENKICRHSYRRLPQDANHYEAEEFPDSEGVTEGDASRSTFLCHPGRFNASDSISCVRSSDTFSWCSGQTYCQPVYVNTSYATCKFSCVNMEWIATDFMGLNFTDEPEIVGGSCTPSLLYQTTTQTTYETTTQNDFETTTQSTSDAETTTHRTSHDSTTRTGPQTTVGTSSQTSRGTNPRTVTQITIPMIPVQANESADNETIEIIVVAAWTLVGVLILITLILIYIFFRIKRGGEGHREDAVKKPLRNESQVLDNENGKRGSVSKYKAKVGEETIANECTDSDDKDASVSSNGNCTGDERAENTESMLTAAGKHATTNSDSDGEKAAAIPSTNNTAHDHTVGIENTPAGEEGRGSADNKIVTKESGGGPNIGDETAKSRDPFMIAQAKNRPKTAPNSNKDNKIEATHRVNPWHEKYYPQKSKTKQASGESSTRKLSRVYPEQDQSISSEEITLNGNAPPATAFSRPQGTPGPAEEEEVRNDQLEREPETEDLITNDTHGPTNFARRSWARRRQNRGRSSNRSSSLMEVQEMDTN